MSKNVDRNQVLKNISVRISLKNEASWIQTPTKKKEQEDARMNLAVESSLASVRRKSYVLSTAKKFESVDYPLSPPPRKTSEGDPANPANGEVILPQEAAQPEGSIVETTDDAKPRAAAEEHIENGRARPEKTATTAEESEEGCAEPPVSQSNVERSKSAAEVPTHEEGHLQNGEAQIFYSTKENPEAGSIVEPAEQSVATAENTEEYADTTAEQSHIDHTESKQSAAPDFVVESDSKSPAEGERCPPEQSAEETADAEDVRESPPPISAVHKASPGDEAVPPGPVKETPEAASESPAEPAAEASVGLMQSAVEAPEAPAVSQTGAEEAVECKVQPVEQSAVEPKIRGALEPGTDSEAGAAQGTFSFRVIELTDALDVEPPAAEAAPIPVEDPDPSQEEPEPNQSPSTNITKREKLQQTSVVRAVCSLCDQSIDGTVKFTLSEPPVTCHPECLKCGVCANVLGELLTPVFLHDQVIHCDGCFAKALEA